MPFCRVARCPYCDFYSVTGAEGQVGAYLEGLEKELESAAVEEFPAGGAVESVYFGGGTPSVLEPEQVAWVIRAVRQHWRLAAEAEITLECNPEDLDPAQAADYSAAGVNRLSLGCQSFAAGSLAALGRRHGAAQNRKAIESALGAGFERISADLILGSPGSDSRTLTDSISQALSLGVGHLSIYGYHLDQGCRAYGDPAYEPAGEDTYRAQYLTACGLLEKAGWRHYEISNWASSERDTCRHNLLYWERELGYLGCGPSAHSFIPPDLRAWNPADLGRWLAARVSGGRCQRRNERLNAEEIALEKVMLGLRLSRGIKTSLAARFLGPETAGELGNLVAEGLARETAGDRLGLTDRGFLVFDSIVERLTSSRSFQT